MAAPKWLVSVITPIVTDMLTKQMKDSDSDLVKTITDVFLHNKSGSVVSPHSTKDDSIDSKKELSDEVNKYKKPIGKRLTTSLALPAIGDVAGVTGNYLAAKNSILGSAMQAMASELNPKSKQEIYGPGLSQLASGLANATLQTKAALSKGIGDAVANRMYNFADTEKAEEDAARAMAYNSVYGGNNAFYELLGKSTPNATKRSSGDSHTQK